MQPISTETEDSLPWSREEMFRGYQKTTTVTPLQRIPTIYKTALGQYRRQWIGRQGDVVSGKSSEPSQQERSGAESLFRKSNSKLRSHISSPDDELSLTETLEATFSSHMVMENKDMEYVSLGSIVHEIADYYSHDNGMV